MLETSTLNFADSLCYFSWFFRENITPAERQVMMSSYQQWAGARHMKFHFFTSENLFKDAPCCRLCKYSNNSHRVLLMKEWLVSRNNQQSCACVRRNEFLGLIFIFVIRDEGNQFIQSKERENDQFIFSEIDKMTNWKRKNANSVEFAHV